MSKKRIAWSIVLPVACLVALAVLFLPWPNHVSLDQPCVEISLYGSAFGEERSMHMEAWKLDYLFGPDMLLLQTVSVNGEEPLSCDFGMQKVVYQAETAYCTVRGTASDPDDAQIRFDPDFQEIILQVGNRAFTTWIKDGEPEARAIPIDMLLHGALITADGRLICNMEFPVSGTYYDVAFGRGTIDLQLDLPDQCDWMWIPYTDSDSPVTVVNGFPQTSYAMYDKIHNDMSFTYVTFDLDAGMLIAYIPSTPTAAIIVGATEPDTMPEAVMAHFDEFLRSVAAEK